MTDEEYWENLKATEPEVALAQLWEQYGMIIEQIQELTGITVCAYLVNQKEKAI